MKRDIDFLKVYNGQFHKRRGGTAAFRQMNKKGLIGGTVAVVVAAILSFGVMGYNVVLNREIAELEEYFATAEEVKKGEEIQKEKERLYAMENYFTLYTLAENVLKTRIVLDKKMYDAISAPMTGNMRLTNIEYADGVFYPVLTTTDIAEIPVYVTKLRESGVFYSVTYNGYNGTVVGAGKSFVVTCRLEGGVNDEKAE